MEKILSSFYYQNSLKSYLLSIGILIGGLVLAKTLVWFIHNVGRKLVSKSKIQLDDLILQTVESSVFAIVGSSGFYLAISRLKLPPKVFNFCNHVFLAFMSLAVTLFLVRLTKGLFDIYITPLVEKSENTLDDQLLPIVRKGIVLTLWALGIIVGLNNAGFDVGALIAGMGIGGLALAMAAKDTISNFFGGITIFADRPFKLHDRVKISGHEGFVEEIGIRSTRLRTLEKRIVTIPNAKFTESIIENVSLEPARKVSQTFGLTYDTSRADIELAIELLDKIVRTHPSTNEDVLTSFSGFGDFSLNVLLIYYIRSGEDILKTQTQINLEILETFNRHKLSFAFPTQTIEMNPPLGESFKINNTQMSSKETIHPQ